MPRIFKWHTEIVLLVAFGLAIIIEILDVVGLLKILPEKSTSLIILVLLAVFVGWDS